MGFGNHLSRTRLGRLLSEPDYRVEQQPEDDYSHTNSNDQNLVEEPPFRSRLRRLGSSEREGDENGQRG